MAKNLIPEIAQMLGVERGEEFKIKGYGETSFMITDDKGLMATDDEPETGWEPANALFVALLNGDEAIVKLPWKPKEGQTVYSFYSVGLDGTLKVVDFIWVNDIITFQALVKAGWVYKTRAEAEAALPAVAKEFGVEYEL